MSCENNEIHTLDKLRAIFLTKYLSQNSRTISNAIQAINQNSQFILSLKDCDSENCIQDRYLNNLEYINKLIKYNGETPSRCKFDENGTYTCGGNNICIVGESVFQMSRASDNKYKLDIWENSWDYDPWNSREGPSYSLEGSMGIIGTYPCTHEFYDFGGITMSYGGCVEPAAEPVDTMFRVSCDSGSTFCPSGSLCATSQMQ